MGNQIVNSQIRLQCLAGKFFRIENETIAIFPAYAVAKTNHEVPEHLACFVAAHASCCSTSRDEMSDDIDDTFLDLSDFEDEAEN